MKQSLLSILSFIAATLLTGCAWNPAGTSEPAPVAIVRLDSLALSGDSAAYISAGSSARLWLKVVGADSAAVSHYLASLQGKPYNHFVTERFASTDSLSRALAPIFYRLNLLDEDLAPATVATVVSPYNQSIVTADSTAFIALNHYLGPELDFYAYFPYYQRRLKDSSRIGIDLAEAVISPRFPYSPFTRYPTSLSRMAAEGALVEAVMRVTGASEQEVLGLDDEQYRWLIENEQAAWESMLQRDMIFTTDPAIVEALVRPNAATTILHPESPGRSGRFFGHRIVSSYLKNNPQSQLSSILKPDFYEDPKLLENAGYVGK